eukprot:12893640-Prorocentrum_lima.AAC.1
MDSEAAVPRAFEQSTNEARAWQRLIEELMAAKQNAARPNSNGATRCGEGKALLCMLWSGC